VVVIGIDVGLTGAVAAVDNHGTCSIADLPTLTLTRRIDGRALILLLRQFVPAGEPALCVFEDVRPRPNPKRGTSIVTEGSLMRSRGIVEAVTDIARFDTKVVQPQVWKRFYGLLGKDKEAARAMARSLYPMAQGELARKKDHNRAEALLIAHYGQGRMA
jgi:hypothetical protein